MSAEKQTIFAAFEKWMAEHSLTREEAQAYDAHPSDGMDAAAYLAGWRAAEKSMESHS